MLVDTYSVPTPIGEPRPPALSLSLFLSLAFPSLLALYQRYAQRTSIICMGLMDLYDIDPIRSRIGPYQIISYDFVLASEYARVCRIHIHSEAEAYHKGTHWTTITTYHNGWQL